MARTLGPVLSEIAGLPGAPARISQAGTTYRQGPGNSVGVGLAGPLVSGTPPVFRLLLPEQLPGPVMTGGELAAAIRSDTGPAILASLTGDGPGASPAQRAVTTALMTAAGLRPHVSPRDRPPAYEAPPVAAPGSPAGAAARRLAALPAPARRAWLMRHLVALRAGRLTLAQLP
jgi:hypothetical protein